ncbi:Cationic amino acid transporter 9, chloroplastic [Apostasia shenzhenica]|uniref:Cationic amino acid transporter 9, chloroplastic n=1 Tax=Apostasia shenzhenica TaxID=1088818 RepID=A0A2I0A428_9ASPA|nr:Cationic amino acid transporter 9, chloroplastic [Apostasia shenzhenica]
MGGAAAAASSSSGRSFFSGFLTASLRRKRLPGTGEFRAHHGEGLVRRLGLFELLLLGIGASIGSGIFVFTGTVARDAGPARFPLLPCSCNIPPWCTMWKSKDKELKIVLEKFVSFEPSIHKKMLPWAPQDSGLGLSKGVTLSFLLAGAACVLNALCYAELASRFPAVLMLDYHIGAASIARSLASYVVSLFELFPVFKGIFPSWIGHGGLEIFGGFMSINILAPTLLLVLTIILCCGVKESSTFNSFITSLKVVIVILVICAGAFEVDVSNWSLFAPNGFKAIVTGATVVYFAYVGFDAVANSAEESKKPQRDLPIGILGSLLVCAFLYFCVCLVITGMVPYQLLGEDAPLAEAFTAKGMRYVSVLISIGAVAGLTTTLLVGLYVQSRLYLGLGRDGLLPSVFAKVHPARHTPIHSQIWVGCVAGILGGLFNVHELSHILSVGSLTGYSVVSACVITLRWKDMAPGQVFPMHLSSRHEGVICLLAVGFCGFAAGIFYRYDVSFILLLIAVLMAILAGAALHFRQIYEDPPGFSCPGVPVVPIASIFINIFLFAQLHEEAWIRFFALSIISVVFYATYGQYNADSEASEQTVLYQRAPSLES